ncbi:Na/Pi symporter [Granulosicoccaceae sp. 1_MG-2023]|nr:Na/Pi symporter [Granulosicoccaceae sp. 1_MG-2023]
MTTTTLDRPQIIRTGSYPPALRWMLIALLVYLLLVAVALVSGGFKMSAGDSAKELFAFASNPVTAVIVGVLATALIQSSSTVTSIIVGLVAGGLPVSIAIPMVMGANMGTTLTNTIVSLGMIRSGEDFKRGFAAATIHDFFNLLSILIFLPLEIMFGFLDKIGHHLATLFIGGESMATSDLNFIKPLVSPPVKFAKSAVHDAGMSDIAGGILLIVLGVVGIFLVISYIGKNLKVLMVGRAKEILHTAVGRGPMSGIFTGTLLTVLVQSSSTTTSLVVPLAGSGTFSLRQVYPFTLGANIGTCITALLAATAVSGPNAIFALEIAFVHLVYNISGVALIYSLPFLREIPIKLASGLAGLAVQNKLYVVAYIGFVFFLLPLVMIGGSKLLGF